MSYSQDPLSTPETYYYKYDVYYSGDEEYEFADIDSILVECSHNLDTSPDFSGGARDFMLTLENYDENNKTGEVLGSFVVRLWEDDDSELNLMISAIKEELEAHELMVEDIGFVGTGPPRR
jgi:hypothetical protein